MQLLERSWKRSWLALNAQSANGLFEALVSCYQEPHRKYHTLQHLSECIERLEANLEQAEQPGEVEVALWFHDAIYDLKKKDNEHRSAQWAERELAASGVPADVVARVYRLVMATQHTALPSTQGER